MARRKKREHDFAVTAFRVVQEAVYDAEEAEEVISEAPKLSAAERGRLGGKKGGKARAARLTPERRREIARKAAAKRWGSRT